MSHTDARKQAAARHGIQTDDAGFPKPDWLEAWHRMNNPQLFVKKPKSIVNEVGFVLIGLLIGLIWILTQ